MFATLAAISLAVLTGCDIPTSKAHAVSLSPPSLTCPTDHAPLVVGLFVDKSASGTTHRTPQPTFDDLAPLADAVAIRGGILALGMIDGGKDTLYRLEVTPPDELCPPEPDWHRNPLIRRGQQRDYDRAVRAVQQREATRLQRVVAKRAAFRDQVEDALAAPADYTHTDFWGAFRRSRLLHQERRIWDRAPTRITLFVSDGIHDDAGSAVVTAPTDTDAALILVNGTPVDPALEPFRPLQFESVSAAVQYIANL